MRFLEFYDTLWVSLIFVLDCFKPRNQAHHRPFSFHHATEIIKLIPEAPLRGKRKKVSKKRTNKNPELAHYEMSGDEKGEWHSQSLSH